MKKKKNISIKLMWVSILFSITAANAQTTSLSESTAGNDWFSNPGFYLLSGIVIILIFLGVGLAKTTVSLGKVIAQKSKKTIAALLLLVISSSAFAQTETVTSNERPVAHLPKWVFDPNLYLMAFFILILIIVIVSLYNTNMKLIRALSPETARQKNVTIQEVLAEEKKPTLLRKIYLRLVDSVPVEREKDVLLDHNYDGIKELDNNLPPWWKYGFYFTIVFGVFYLLIYHVSGTGKLQAEEYKDEVLLAEKQKEERMKANAENVNEENVVSLTEAEGLSKGKETFTKLCSACHRADGGGQVGPNLTDEFWIHGGGIKNVFKTITYGVPSKGMLSWKSQLSPKQIQQVASYVLSLKGSNPPGPKEPQGDKWIEEAVSPADSGSTIRKDTTIMVAVDSLKKIN